MSNPNLAEGFVKILNRYGFAFQHAAIAVAEDAFKNANSGFAFEAAEFPVDVDGRETKIDFVLRHVMKPLLMVCECKRVNPNIANWCFAKAPYVHREPTNDALIFDLIQRFPDNLHINPTQIHTNLSPYHIAVEMRTSPAPPASGTQPSPEGGSGRADFEKAVQQVLLGTNGLLNFFFFRGDLGKSAVGPKLILLPVIVTTAQLWASNIDLKETDLVTGNFPASKAHLEAAKWLAYNEHMSPALKFAGASKSAGGEISSALHADFIRTIFVVSAAHLREFFVWASSLLAA